MKVVDELHFVILCCFLQGKSYTEFLSQLKERKRRPKSYRTAGKAAKSYTEQMRELIQTQMELMADLNEYQTVATSKLNSEDNLSSLAKQMKSTAKK